MLVNIDTDNPNLWRVGDMWSGSYRGRPFSGPIHKDGTLSLVVGLSSVAKPYNNRMAVRNQNYVTDSVTREVFLPTAPVSLVASGGATWVLNEDGWVIVSGKSRRTAPNPDEFTVLYDADQEV